MKVDAIKELVGLGYRPFTIRVGDQTYIYWPKVGSDGIQWTQEKPAQPPAAPIDVEALAVHTLDGLVAYLKKDFDDLDPKTLALHVVSESQVDLISQIADIEQPVRRLYARAVFQKLVGTTQFQFGQYMEQEPAVISLMSLFEASEMRDKLVTLVGNLSDGLLVTLVDNGLTQETAIKAGLKPGNTTEVPPIVSLAPFRTFREVKQPESNFLIRLKSGAKEGVPPLVALFEADGGKWRLDAIESIADYLSERLEGITIIA